MLAAIGHERLASSLDGITFEKEFKIDDFKNIIKQKMTVYDTLNAANYRPSEKENEECGDESSKDETPNGDGLKYIDGVNLGAGMVIEAEEQQQRC